MSLARLFIVGCRRLAYARRWSDGRSPSLFDALPATSRTLNEAVFLTEAIFTPDGRAGLGQMDYTVATAATAGLVFAALVVFVGRHVRRSLWCEDFTLCLFRRQLVCFTGRIFSVCFHRIW